MRHHMHTKMIKSVANDKNQSGDIQKSFITYSR